MALNNESKKIKLFQICQENMASLGIRRNQSGNSGKSKLIWLTFGLCTLMGVAFLSFKANTFMEYTVNIYNTSAMIIITTFFTVWLLKKESVFEVIDNAENLFDKKNENPASDKRQSDTCQQIETLSNIGYLVIAKVTPFAVMLPTVVYSYFSYFTTNLGNEAFELPMLLWFPFNWKSPLGYLVVVIFESIANSRLFLFIALTICFAIGAFIYVNSVTDDLKNDLKSINKIAKTKNKHKKILESLAEFTEFYSMLKQLIRDSVEIYQPLFMIVCTWCLISICGVMLLIQMELLAANLVLLCVITLDAAYVFGTLALLCELCQQMTDAFEEICDEASALNWYLFPLEVQKILPIILIGTQQPVEFECFGSISATRETFRIIIKSAINYFLVIREFI